MAMTVIDFPGFTPEHLSFKKGEIVSILDRDPENGWMQGQIGERVGWFPMEFGDILLEPYATGPDGKPVMRSAARNRAKEVAKQMAENKNTEQMLNISALLQEKYNMVEYAKEHFDERNLFESKSGVNAKIGTIKGTLAGTLRKKTGQDVIKITITEEIASKALSWTPVSVLYTSFFISSFHLPQLTFVKKKTTPLCRLCPNTRSLAFKKPLSKNLWLKTLATSCRTWEILPQNAEKPKSLWSLLKLA